MKSISVWACNKGKALLARLGLLVYAKLVNIAVISVIFCGSMMALDTHAQPYPSPASTELITVVSSGPAISSRSAASMNAFSTRVSPEIVGSPEDGPSLTQQRAKTPPARARKNSLSRRLFVADRQTATDEFKDTHPMLQEDSDNGSENENKDGNRNSLDLCCEPNMVEQVYDGMLWVLNCLGGCLQCL